MVQYTISSIYGTQSVITVLTVGHCFIQNCYAYLRSLFTQNFMSVSKISLLTAVKLKAKWKVFEWPPCSCLTLYKRTYRNKHCLFFEHLYHIQCLAIMFHVISFALISQILMSTCCYYTLQEIKMYEVEVTSSGIIYILNSEKRDYQFIRWMWEKHRNNFDPINPFFLQRRIVDWKGE